jgi:hypothetical protein
MDKKQSIWNEIARDDQEESKLMRTSFLNDITSRDEGISADKEKFIKGLKTFNPKLLPANKHDND